MPTTVPRSARLRLPSTAEDATLRVGRRSVTLTHLRKVVWPNVGLTKRDLLQYYADVSPALLPHLAHRAMVMKRYPNGIHGKSFFMKRAPSTRPERIQTCAIPHRAAGFIAFPIVQDLPSMLCLIKLGCN